MEWTQTERIIETAAQKDPAYRDILKRRDAAWLLYENAMKALTAEQREAVESYAYFDVELEHQKTRLAYYIGRIHGSAAATESRE